MAQMARLQYSAAGWALGCVQVAQWPNIPPKSDQDGHGHAGHDHPGPLLGAIWGHWTIYMHPNAQPAALYCSLATWVMLGLVRWQLWLLHAAFMCLRRA